MHQRSYAAPEALLWDLRGMLPTPKDSMGPVSYTLDIEDGVYRIGVSTEMPDFTPFMEVTIGNCLSGPEYKSWLVHNNIVVGRRAADMLTKGFFCVQREVRIPLVRLRPLDLGLRHARLEEFHTDPRSLSYKNFVGQAMRYNLYPCFPEVGPALRYVYQDQPKGEQLPLAMDPIRIATGHCGFSINNVGGKITLQGTHVRTGYYDSIKQAGVYVFMQGTSEITALLEIMKKV